jgi:hypothetical protein
MRMQFPFEGTDKWLNEDASPNGGALRGSIEWSLSPPMAKSKPRATQLQAIAVVRKMGKKAVAIKLAE